MAHFIEDDESYREWLRDRFALAPPSMGDPGEKFFKRTALWRLGRRAFGRRNSLDIVRDLNGAWMAKVRASRREAEVVEGLLHLDSGLAEYARNVEDMMREARARSLRLVFLTQPSTWRKA